MSITPDNVGELGNRIGRLVNANVDENGERAENALDASLIRFALAPIAQPPKQAPARSPVLCKCGDVTEAQIKAEFAAGRSLDEVQDKLKCGTFCGGCLPELKKMATAMLAEPA